MERKSTDAQLRASRKYDKENTKLLQLKLNKKTDEDILNFLDTLKNKQGFIKELIRQHMAGSNEPLINKCIVEGEFDVGKSVVVMIDGKEFKRKAYFSTKYNEPVITVLNTVYAKSEFK